MTQSTQASYGLKEEIANAVTHGLGMVFGIVGLVFLLLKANEYHADTMTIASMSIYGGSMILLFLASTLYHSIPYQRAKRWLKTLDHCAIYLLIAGSYTPFLLVSLRTPLAIGLMAVIWVIALVGIIMKLAFVYRFKRFSLFTYLAMGWLSLVVIYQLAINLDVGGLVLLAAGGIIYSLGVIFYVAKRIPYNHAIWHLFVLAGCACHFFAIYLYVQPVPAVS
ncbi:PAQR family membrane homeostasis protein TrhA [Vibrio paucivorans]|uniref:Hemolysin III family protein n=1 Tax=Vibrio paucivorans TaxID=2829489 RepID=A0A9X3HQY9_9VIBR|nr:hemolysin III family protein [Vibrio paucivorans]MCW8333564.1 hemolysin III family protein [Vibrio paucivorans]